MKEPAMRQDIEVKIGSAIYGKIQAARMSEHDRRIAINAMRNAELIVDGIFLIVDGILWVVKKIKHLGEPARWANLVRIRTVVRK